MARAVTVVVPNLNSLRLSIFELQARTGLTDKRIIITFFAYRE